MGFIKKIWKDRISEFPTRRSLTKTDGTSELVTVSRSEGMISEEGDAFSAENMNDFENRVANGFSELTEKMGSVLLWENQNPSTNFAAQKITLDLSKYETVIIVHMPSISYPTVYMTQMSFKTSDGTFAVLNAAIMGQALWRTVTIDDTGITFSGGVYGGNASPSDGACIPVRIYGKP